MIRCGPGWKTVSASGGFSSADVPAGLEKAAATAAVHAPYVELPADQVRHPHGP
ncbi:phosphoribosylformylglycinamidine (FGAM) synthase-like amidotransferase family enzyme [Streptomyces sp. LBL]|uniref:hypothetical protein n=1 Tax=Streptomyces sp. LBL TaxID=2940562 RepID=UPI002473EF45|nr:hypothetical protein [Streptomyces sp. LBL]MDH6624574.1 phosphoribosylformylglycinamidine (FGAM) synthase-like amidotransferase family enzyme [Streptomyces sp. LBL]